LWKESVMNELVVGLREIRRRDIFYTIIRFIFKFRPSYETNHNQIVDFAPSLLSQVKLEYLSSTRTLLCANEPQFSTHVLKELVNIIDIVSQLTELRNCVHNGAWLEANQIIASTFEFQQKNKEFLLLLQFAPFLETELDEHKSKIVFQLTTLDFRKSLEDFIQVDPSIAGSWNTGVKDSFTLIDKKIGILKDLAKSYSDKPHQSRYVDSIDKLLKAAGNVQKLLISLVTDKQSAAALSETLEQEFLSLGLGTDSLHEVFDSLKMYGRIASLFTARVTIRCAMNLKFEDFEPPDFEEDISLANIVAHLLRSQKWLNSWQQEQEQRTNTSILSQFEPPLQTLSVSAILLHLVTRSRRGVSINSTSSKSSRPDIFRLDALFDQISASLNTCLDISRCNSRLEITGIIAAAYLNLCFLELTLNSFGSGVSVMAPPGVLNHLKWTLSVQRAILIEDWSNLSLLTTQTVANLNENAMKAFLVRKLWKPS
jgi:hypothetical protein